MLATVLFLCGMLLICHPLVGGLPNLVGLTGTAEYEAVEIQPDGDGFALPNGTSDRAREGVVYGDTFDRIDCFPWFEGRECYLEGELLDHELIVEDDPAHWDGYTHHGRFYERVTRDTGNGQALALRPVSARTVLGNISTPERDWSQEEETAVETGSVSVRPPLRSAGGVLERNGSFYVVVHTDGPAEAPQPPGRFETTLSVLLGVLSIQAAFRLRPS